MKIGLTPNVTLDGTVNPDFGQVEADPAVVNLTAFETFFSERRPFFVEGTGLYKFQLNCYIVVDCQTNEGLFYSRRIGRSPALHGLYGDAGTATATPIAAATKLTGRTRDGLAFGLLDALTPRVTGVNNQTAEPQTNFAVLRAQQDFDQGNTSVGVIGTAVNRSLDTFTDPYMHKAGYAVGGNVRQRYFKGDYELNAQLTASHVSGTRQAIARTQSNPVHYYQQPDDDLTFDSTRTSLNGYEGQLRFGTYGGGMWVNLGWSDEGKSNSKSYSPYVNVLMGTQFTVGVGFGYSKNTSDAQWFGNFTDAANKTHYSFAHLDQTTVSTSLRVNYTATPDLTFEFYGAPFVSNGTYANVRQISATPEADRYADRFAAYAPPAGSPTAFRFTQLRTNAVVRWEFRPGSTIFMVWQHGRQDSASQASPQSWFKDYNDLMSLHPDNTFLIKMAYWVSK